MKKYTLGAMFFVGLLVSPTFTQAAALTTGQANSLIAVVQSAPGVPANAFVNLITSFSSITLNQAISLITVVQSAPGVPANAFVNLLISFTSDTTMVQTTTQTTTPVTPLTITNSQAPTCNVNTTQSGNAWMLTWTSSGATSATATFGAESEKSVAVSGSATVDPTENTAYTFWFTGPYSKISCSKTITVAMNKSCTITASKSTVIPGEQFSLSWTTYNISNPVMNQQVKAGGTMQVATSGSIPWTAELNNSSATESDTFQIGVGGTGSTAYTPICSATVNITPAPVAVTCSKGDVDSDGLISPADQQKIMKYIVGLGATFTGAEMNNADVTGDGLVNLNDSIDIGKYVARTITAFSACAANTVGLPRITD